MILTIRIPRPLFSGSPQRRSAPATPKLPPNRSFHAVLTDAAEDWVLQGSPRSNFPAVRPQQGQQIQENQSRQISQARKSSPTTLARAWSWLHSRYPLTATKRLRVAETVSLGEKRFVALISVEGREFLVGGGTAGVSLLAQLGAKPQPAKALQDGSAGEVDSE